MTAVKLLLSAALAFAASQAAVATTTPLVEGTHYKIVDPTGKTKQPTVTEFFSYGCPACRGMEGHLANWKASKPQNIKFEYVHVYGMNAQWDLLAKLYYTAEALGILDKTHTATFNYLHLENKRINNENDIVEFLSKFGIEADKIRSTMKSFAVNSRLNFAKQKAKTYKLTGVPSFIVNDKYYLDVKELGTIEMLEKALTEVSLNK